MPGNRLESLHLTGAAVISLISLYLLIRIAVFEGLTSIITDESQYREFLLGLQSPYLLNPLFLALYRISTPLGENWYLGARLLNAVMLVAGLAGLQQLGSRLALRWWQKVTVITAGVCCGASTYALNIMPDLMLTVAVWWCVVLLVSGPRSLQRWEPVILGGAIGLTTLIKPHAIVLLPAFAAGLLVPTNESLPTDTPRRWRLMTIELSGILVAFCAIRWGLGYALAGQTALGLFGGRYEQLGQPFNAGMLSTVMWVMARHSTALLMLMPGLAATLLWTVLWLQRTKNACTDSKRSSKLSQKMRRLTTFLVVALLCSVGAYSIFTAKVATNINIQASLIHFRYYSYLFPIAIAWLMASQWPAKKPGLGWILGVGVVGSGLAVACFLNPTFAPQPSWVEAPVLAIVRRPWVASLLITAGTLLVAGRIRLDLLGMYATALFVVAEAAQFADSHQAMALSRPLRWAEKQLQKLSESSQTRSAYSIILGEAPHGIGGVSRRAAMQRCMGINFWSLNNSYVTSCLKSNQSSTPIVAAFSKSAFNPANHNLCPIDRIQLQGHALDSLYIWKTAGPLQIGQSAQQTNTSLSWHQVDTVGFNKPEHWGISTANPVALIHTHRPLPQKATLTFAARSINPGEVIDISVGSSIHTIKLRSSWQTYIVNLNNRSCIQTIKLTIKNGAQSIPAKQPAVALQWLKIYRPT